MRASDAVLRTAKPAHDDVGVCQCRLHKPPDRLPAAVGHADGDGAIRRHRQGRHLPADADRRRPQGARLVQGTLRGARLHRHGRRGRQHVRAPAGAEQRACRRIAMGSHLDTQPTGGKFDGVLGVLGALEALRTLARSRLRNQRADRDRQLDQRGRLALCAGDAGLRRVRRRVHARLRLLRAPIATARPSATSSTRIGYRGPEKAGGPQILGACSNCTSSKARSSKTSKR